ncbi:bifunctional 3,4-dihydroxy-2-butanone-4-phosphate synthase/GTP cyclohydrolase II [Mycolicibacterium tokaiense]|uniref:Riboflavin biosynthesis protein RibBA n=1 Tax=Mycolicibacterium tokaiense TaxID=39695 RepID=A0A378TG77_9MYCO|nr:bifunctional 3,4-dihydroxy-2-butanone-4-phosphate synthase/GTP cyclohydrolase II [Mycolicibacterium tokaiense]STZ58546.1 bifunctional 3,4-dihydroxy-2-butanone 4-phosphate synthase/GTP cyclohydrolase II protein [Mycolicibacterium tokaiense]
MQSDVKAVIAHIGKGGIAVVVDDHDRENEGDLVVAADAMTPEVVRFFLEHTSGVICVSLDGDRCDELMLPPMVENNTDPKGTAFTVTVDARTGVTTGISAQDRSRTITSLADTTQGPDAFVRPGHVFPLRARDGGVLKRAGHTEAALDLARLGGRGNAGVLCEVVSPDRSRMANREELVMLASEHRLPMTSVADLIAYRLRTERLVFPAAGARLPTEHGTFTCYTWRSALDDAEHVALVCGDVRSGEPVLVRVHSECLTGDTFRSSRCDCGSQLDDAMRLIAAAGCGVIVYLRGQEGRGIGLSHKLAAYNLQEEGHDTVDANLLLGLPVDSREYGVGAQILMELGVRQVRLITNNPAKYSGLEGYGLQIVERVAVTPRVTQDNIAYLRTKQRRMGHLIADVDVNGVAW